MSDDKFPYLSGRAQIVDLDGKTTTPFERWMKAVRELLFALRDAIAAFTAALDTANDEIGALDTRVDALEAGTGFVGIVADLPPQPVASGTRAYVGDATTDTFGLVVTGGGAFGVPVYSDGNDWRIG